MIVKIILWVLVLEVESLESPSRYPLAALDCRYPTKIQSGLVSKICGKTEKDPMVDNVNKTKTTLLQFSNKQVIKGYRCEKKYSIFWEVCGFLSHTKLYAPPTIREPQPITPEECDTMRKTMTYKREDGSLTSITMNEVYTYNFVKHGKLHYSSSNVACEGATVIIHGEEVSSLVEMVSAEVLIKSIEIETDIASTIDLDRNVKLPVICSHLPSCQAGAEAYVLDRPESTCPLNIIRTVDMIPVTVQTDEGQQDALVDHVNKIMLTLKNKEVAPSGCRPVFAMYSTEFDNLKVVIEDIAVAEVSNIKEHLDPSLLDLDLEIRTSESYITYYLQNTLYQQMNSITNKICTINSHNLDLNELSPFHPNSLLRIRGDVIQELQCKPVIATAKIGERRGEQCSSDSLPVWIENQPLRIQARTHLVVEEDPLEMIPCYAAYAPVFLTSDGGTLLAAVPEVKVIDIPLGHLNDDYLHLTDLEEFNHPSFGEDLLYTQQEMEQFNELIHFQRTKQRVINTLISDYCEGNNQCGAYQPSAGTSSAFNLEHLEDAVYSPFQIFFDWSEKLSKIGNICSILIVFLLLMSMTYKISKVLWLAFRHNLGFGQAIRLGLFVDTTLMRALIETPITNSPLSHVYPQQPLPQAPERKAPSEMGQLSIQPTTSPISTTPARLESQAEPWY
jgi:hypothetical protein